MQKKTVNQQRNLNIMVLGAKGMLGTALIYILCHEGNIVHAIDRSNFDVLSDRIDRINLKKIDYVINAIGLTNRRMHGGEVNFYLVNSIFPRLLADYCTANSVPLIHISTDCVFDGRQGPYTETIKPTATDLYGRSKALGEPANCLVLRTSIIGPERKNYYSLLSWFLAQSSCTGYRNHRWNGMTTIQLARIINQIMENDLYVQCRRHVYSEDTTKFELLHLIRDAYKRQTQIISGDDTVPRDTRLRTDFPEFINRFQIRSLKEQIEELPQLSDDQGRWRAVPELDCSGGDL